MMKKIIAVLISLMMLLGTVCVAEQVPAEKVTLGTININGAFTLQCGLPEGYTPVPISVTQDMLLEIIRSEDPNAPIMQLSVAYDEMYSDVERMSDLDAEALELLEQTYIESDPLVEITYGETGYGTLLLIARHETDTLDYVSFFSIYKGYCVEFVLVPSEQAEDKNLTDEQLQICVDFLTELDFIPAESMTAGAISVANQTFVACLTDYNAEANTVKVQLKRSIRLDKDVLDNLKEGDTLNVGTEEITVETLEKDEYGATVNDEINLEYRDDGVRVSYYEHDYMETIAEMELEIPENLVFLDGIDPESGEMLETPTEHTAAELIDMLSAGVSPDFASDNVHVTFDENGQMEEVERFYTSWQ